MSPAQKSRWTIKGLLTRSLIVYIAFGAGVVFGAGVATLTTLAVTGVPDAENVAKILICSE
jgi:hypothetical protein